MTSKRSMILSDCCIDCERKFTDKITAGICSHCKTYRCANCRLKHYCSKNKNAGLFGIEDPPQTKKKLRKVVEEIAETQLSNSSPTDNLLPVNHQESQSEDFSSTLEDDHAAAINTTTFAPTQYEESPKGDPQQEEILPAADQENSSAVVLAVAPLSSSELLIIPNAISFSPGIVSEEPDDHTVANNGTAALAPSLSPSLQIAPPLTNVNDIVDLTCANVPAVIADVTLPELGEPVMILGLSSTKTLPTVPNKNVNDVIIHLTSDSNVRKSGIVGGFVVSDEDTSLVAVLGEIYSTGYRLVHEPKTNMTLSIGSEYAKVNVDGQGGQDRWIFIHALEVSFENLIDNDTLPLNFMFLESSAVKTFLNRCDEVYEWEVLVVPAEDFPLFSIVLGPSAFAIPEDDVDSIVLSVCNHLKKLKHSTGLGNHSSNDCSESHHHTDDDCCQLIAPPQGATDSAIASAVANDPARGRTAGSANRSGSGRTLIQINKPTRDNSAAIQKKSADLKKQQAIEARWNIAITEYRKLTGDNYEKSKGDRIDVFERLVLKIKHDNELNEQKEREQKENDKIQKEKAKKEREQRAIAEKERLAKLAREKNNFASTPTPIGVMAATVPHQPIGLTQSAVSSSTPLYKSDDIDAPVTKKDIERVDSYRKMFQKSILETIMEEQEKRDLQVYFSQTHETGTRKLVLPKTATDSRTLTLEQSAVVDTTSKRPPSPNNDLEGRHHQDYPRNRGVEAEMPFIDRSRSHSSADWNAQRPLRNDYYPDSHNSGQFRRDCDFQYRGSFPREREFTARGNRQPQGEHERTRRQWDDYSYGGMRGRADNGLNYPSNEDIYSQQCDYRESRYNYNMEYESYGRNRYERERYFESEESEYRRYREERFARESSLRERSTATKTMNKDHLEETKSEF